MSGSIARQKADHQRLKRAEMYIARVSGDRTALKKLKGTDPYHSHFIVCVNQMPTEFV